MTIPSKPDLVQLSDALDTLGSERVNAVSVELDDLSGDEIAALMNDEDKKVTRAVQDVLGPIGQAIEVAARTLRAGGRVIYIGAGTSGRLGVLDASEIPPTFSAPPDMIIGVIAGGRDAMFVAQEGAEDDPEQGKADLVDLSLTDKDFVIGLAASGRTPYVLGAIAFAQATGAITAGISCNAGSPLDRASDIAITPVVGPEILTGSTRLKSGTAQKQILNMISTGAMVRLGKCFGNRMVDLNASNDKLKARAINLVADLAPTRKTTAHAALVAANWDIKIAILTAKTALSVADAASLISASNGHLRRAIAAADGQTP